MDISVVVPVYKGEACLPELCRRLTRTLDEMRVEYELIWVDDGSPDNGWKVMLALAQTTPRLRNIRLSRNFGQHPAIAAGLARAKGDWIVVMDCDLQDQPEEIPRLYAKAKEGFDIVFARRTSRQDTWFKRATSSAFYALLSYLSRTEQDATVANFGVYRRAVIDAVLSFPEQTLYFPVMVRWVGFDHAAIEVTHATRFAGESSYDLRRLVRLAVQICLAFSDRLLVLTVWLGAFVTLASAAGVGGVIWGALTGRFSVVGWPSLIVSIWLTMGLTTLVVGTVGLYVARIFNETKQRPRYIVREDNRP